MSIRIPIVIMLTMLSWIGRSQSEAIENRTTDYYFEQIAELELTALLAQRILIDSVTIAEEYLDSETGNLNNEGFQKYAELKMGVYQSFFQDYLYQQKVEYGDDVYVLYFTMAGFDDMQWDIIKWRREHWNSEERLSRQRAERDPDIEKILWNYDEADKNLENIRIFIKDDYLVMERGNLYHSLYDLTNETVVLNEISPWSASGGRDKAGLNEWIKKNLHDKIEKYLSGE